MNNREFNIGDYLEVLIDRPQCAQVKKGDIVKVTSKDDHSFSYIDQEGGHWGASSDHAICFRLVSDLRQRQTTLPGNSIKRKRYPLYRGLLRYFPKALAEVAHVSQIGNDKHNPGQELHHSRGKSGDHEDCILRHLIDVSEDFGKGKGYDENGVPQVAYIAWRALAFAQEWLEKNQNAPLAPGAKEERNDRKN